MNSIETQIKQVDNPETVNLPELTDAEFFDRYACDRFTATVLANRYQYIVQHMCGHLLTNAFSPILRDWYDFAATVSGPPQLDYPMSAVSDSLPNFLGTMTDAVRNTVEEFGPGNLRPGDVLVANDPYRIGTHVNDYLYVRPVFHEGEICGFVNLQAHMLDTGGVVPGGFSGTKTNIYENGLVLAPQLLYRDDEQVRSTFSLILDNSRWGDVLQADIKSIYQSVRLGERFIHESIERYGIEAYLGSLRYVTDVAAFAMAQALASIPDGDYEATDYLDCDGIDDSEEYRFQVCLRVRGDRAEVDLSGTSRQARTSINAGWLDAKTSIAIALKLLLEPDTPVSSGTLRNVDIVLPMGTITSALPPEGPIFCYMEPNAVLVSAVLRALKGVMGPRAVGGDYSSPSIHNADGSYEDGSPWLSACVCGGEIGPWGATRHGDAESSMASYLGNAIAAAVEMIEVDAPVVLMRKEYIADSGGAGINRGGSAIRKDSLWLRPAAHNSMPLHVKSTPGFGVHGGGDGTPGAVWKWDTSLEEREWIGTDAEAYASATPVAGMLDPGDHRPDPENGEYFYFARENPWRTEIGAQFRYQTAGGGGWGDPMQRDPEAVKRDVRDEYVSVTAAGEVFGVAIVGDPATDPEGLSIDHERTAELRRAAESKRDGDR